MECEHNAFFRAIHMNGLRQRNKNRRTKVQIGRVPAKGKVQLLTTKNMYLHKLHRFSDHKTFEIMFKLFTKCSKKIANQQERMIAQRIQTGLPEVRRSE